MPRPYKQEPPFCIQVELALGCNLACPFCGINGIGMGKAAHSQLMTVETATAIASNIKAAGWNSRIEFARRGEPLLNPDVENILAVFRQHLPRHSMMMLTNGTRLLPDPAQRAAVLFNAGLNVLAVEEYEHARHYISKLLAGEQVLLFKVLEYPANPKGNPHSRRTPKTRDLVLIRDISKTTQGTHSTLNNHGGYAGPLVSYNKPCAKPFRELSVNWDGTINYCCIAWGGEGVCGNANTDDLATVWNGERFTAVRRYLLHGQRSILTCVGCDHPSYRTGLLPDKYGQRQDAYPPPDEATAAVVHTMEAEGHQVQPHKVYLSRRLRFLEGDK